MDSIFENVASLTPFSLLDYPGRTSCILWFGGCNLRCSYCHNPDFVLGPFPRFGSKGIVSFLESRVGLLEGVVLSGGECLLCPEIGAICKSLRRMGFRVKLDSNGCRPDVLRKLIEGEVVDYVALDYKSPRERFEAVTGRDSFGAFAQSLEMLIGSDVDFETRTTVHSHLLDEQDIGAIILDLENRGYRKNYYVQNFVDHGPSARTLSPLPVNRRLDRSRILASDLFEVRFRNFD